MKETREYYNLTCPVNIQFRNLIAKTVKRESFTDEEWLLKESIDPTTDTIIAKARWVLHCERCKLDHRNIKRINFKILQDRTIYRTELILPKWEEFIKKNHEKFKEDQTSKPEEKNK